MDEATDALEDALTELRFRCGLLDEGPVPGRGRRAFPVDAISLHIPLAGRCHIDVALPIWLHRLEPGEILMVKQGVDGALRATSDGSPPPKVLSMRVDFDAPHGHPLLESLPPLIRATVRKVPAPGSFEPLLAALLAEYAMPMLGRREVSRALCEGLFVQALRMHLHDLDWTDKGWLRALADPVIKGQLSPPDPAGPSSETVRSLADASGRSERRIRARFAQFAGSSPSEHIRRSRARRAARLLRDGETDLARIARLTGYRTRQAFCRAFKRELGVSPAAYWRSANGRRFPRQPKGPTK
jgi:AraC-type DNA-binding domain-containing proteins